MAGSISAGTQRQLTRANVATINELETLMNHSFDDGKALYQRSDKVRLQDYTYKQLLKQVHRAVPAGDVASV